MPPVGLVRVADAMLDVAVPSRPGRVAGVSMAGFRGRADDPVSLRVVPYPAFTVFIDFGDVELVDDASGARKRDSVVVRMAPGSVRAGGRDVDHLQVRLSPVVAHAALGGSAEQGSALIALDDLWGRDAERIRERLRAAGSWDERFTVMDAALARRQEAGPAVDPEVSFVWGEMARSRGRARVERLAAEVGWSRRRLWSRFRSQVGLTPKRAAMLIRFDHVAHRLAAGHSAALVAAESGFVDQSHLCRDVMSFTGMTPTEVADAPWLTVDDLAWPARERALRG
ncbi:helix-turn-helix domain-containing protein [Plantactinospora sp. GCM10030261]|uniref:helix-turn-helix domain-containing protein n=1 Tax=Plantactinospora sp. GCM10030261 TaxID=3273420 RepID=UPI003607B8C1